MKNLNIVNLTIDPSFCSFPRGKKIRKFDKFLNFDSYFKLATFLFSVLSSILDLIGDGKGEFMLCVGKKEIKVIKRDGIKANKSTSLEERILPFKTFKKSILSLISSLSENEETLEIDLTPVTTRKIKVKIKEIKEKFNPSIKNEGFNLVETPFFSETRIKSEKIQVEKTLPDLKKKISSFMKTQTPLEKIGLTSVESGEKKVAFNSKDNFKLKEKKEEKVNPAREKINLDSKRNKPVQTQKKVFSLNGNEKTLLKDKKNHFPKKENKIGEKHLKKAKQAENPIAKSSVISSKKNPVKERSYSLSSFIAPDNEKIDALKTTPFSKENIASLSNVVSLSKEVSTKFEQGKKTMWVKKEDEKVIEKVIQRENSGGNSLFGKMPIEKNFLLENKKLENKEYKITHADEERKSFFEPKKIEKQNKAFVSFSKEKLTEKIETKKEKEGENDKKLVFSVKKLSDENSMLEKSVSSLRVPDKNFVLEKSTSSLRIKVVNPDEKEKFLKNIWTQSEDTFVSVFPYSNEKNNNLTKNSFLTQPTFLFFHDKEDQFELEERKKKLKERENISFPNKQMKEKDFPFKEVGRKSVYEDSNTSIVFLNSKRANSLSQNERMFYFSEDKKEGFLETLVKTEKKENFGFSEQKMVKDVPFSLEKSKMQENIFEKFFFSSSVKASEFIDRIVHRVKLMRGKEHNEAKFLINSKEFGKIQVHLVMEKNNLVVQIRVSESRTGQLLQSSFSHLKQSLEKEGIILREFSMDFGQSLSDFNFNEEKPKTKSFLFYQQGIQNEPLTEEEKKQDLQIAPYFYSINYLA